MGLACHAANYIGYTYLESTGGFLWIWLLWLQIQFLKVIQNVGSSLFIYPCPCRSPPPKACKYMQNKNQKRFLSESGKQILSTFVLAHLLCALHTVAHVIVMLSTQRPCEVMTYFVDEEIERLSDLSKVPGISGWGRCKGRPILLQKPPWSHEMTSTRTTSQPVNHLSLGPQAFQPVWGAHAQGPERTLSFQNS